MHFQPGNQEHRKVKKVGRPRKKLRLVTEIIGEENLEALVRQAFADAAKSDGPSRGWFLSQLPKMAPIESRLPEGLPKLDGLAGCMSALTEIGEQARAGKLTIEAAARAVDLILALGSARASLLAKFAPKIDAETSEAIRQEQELKRKVPVASAPMIGGPVH